MRRARSGSPRARSAARERRPAVRASPRRLIPSDAGSGWRYRRSSFAASESNTSRSGGW